MPAHQALRTVHIIKAGSAFELHVSHCMTQKHLRSYSRMLTVALSLIWFKIFATSRGYKPAQHNRVPYIVKQVGTIALEGHVHI